MKIRLMGVPTELDKIQNIIKTLPGVDIISISKEYPNRGYSNESRIYIDCKINTNYQPAEVVDLKAIEKQIEN